MTTALTESTRPLRAVDSGGHGASPSIPQPRQDLQRVVQVAAREWRCTVDALDSPVLVIESDGRVRRLNMAAAALLDRTFSEAIGATLPELASEEPWASASGAVESSRLRRTPDRRQCRDASSRTWEIATTVSRWGGGEWVVLVLHDLTERIALEERLRRTEVMSALGSLVAGVAHEARNPLFGISAALDALVARVGDDSRITPFVDVLQGEVARLRDLVHDLFEYGKAPTGACEPGDVSVVLAESVRTTAPLAEAGEVTIRLAIDPPLPPVLLNGPRLAYVFMNLLQNAIQHSSAGGVVEVAVAPVEAPRGSARSGLTCVVRDRGAGIAPADLPRIFEPFFSRRRGGFGLGLAVAHRIVEEHGGTLRARNRAGGGAELEVWLPSVHPPAGPGGAP